MQDSWQGEELVSQFRHSPPQHSCSLAARANPPMPENEDVVSKRAQRRAVGRHGVVGEISGDDLPEPFPSFGNWPVHSPSQRLLDLPELCPHAVATRLPPNPEVASLGLIANEHKA